MFLSSLLIILLLFKRDVKLKNVLLDSNGNAKICDFGGCKRMTEDRLSKNKTGTPGYRSPESLNSFRLDYSLDYWSFGICVYKMLTGEHPFDKDEDVTNGNYLMPDPNEKMKVKNIEIDKNACDFVSKLLVKNLEERLIAKELIKNDPFFSEIDWIRLEKGQIEPPIKPDLVIIHLALII